MNIRINEKLSIETDIPFQSIQKLAMTWEINDHGRVSFSGIVKREESGSRGLHEDYLQTTVRFILKGNRDNESDETLFCGQIEQIDLKYTHGVLHALVMAGSASMQLDKKKLCCTFQDISQTYAEAAKAVSALEDGRVICSAEDKKLEKPVICYHETAWEFEKRIAGLQNSYIIPDIVTGRPNLWFGMRKGKEMIESSSSAEVNIRKSYVNGEKGRAVISHCLESRDSYLLGDWKILTGRKCVVYKKETILLHGEVRFLYWLANEKDLETEPFYNKRFTGLSLSATVKKTRNETVQVQFDIDGKRGTYFYPWRPESGNALYAMPENGSRVEVYFLNHDERQGIVLRCLHDEKNKDKEVGDKLFETPDAAVGLFDGSIEMVKSKSSLKLRDKSSIGLQGEQLTIEGNGKIKMTARNIRLSASTEIKSVTGM
ncbi:hypothetical protein [Clostridium sp. HBUAS56010]|uniref:hypothetical protein n=1 Tax=Clostridium sp. HBUAS56010 TaxID=2571127 RepID=UPI001178B661|nr:hypothetical protein [Clostridium sp. HBUAS56010]